MNSTPVISGSSKIREHNGSDILARTNKHHLESASHNPSCAALVNKD